MRTGVDKSQLMIDSSKLKITNNSEDPRIAEVACPHNTQDINKTIKIRQEVISIQYLEAHSIPRVYLQEEEDRFKEMELRKELIWVQESYLIPAFKSSMERHSQDMDK